MCVKIVVLLTRTCSKSPIVSSLKVGLQQHWSNLRDMREPELKIRKKGFWFLCVFVIGIIPINLYTPLPPPPPYTPHTPIPVLAYGIADANCKCIAVTEYGKET